MSDPTRDPNDKVSGMPNPIPKPPDEVSVMPDPIPGPLDRVSAMPEPIPAPGEEREPEDDWCGTSPKPKPAVQEDVFEEERKPRT
jgi:hypothetical protein